MSSKTLAQAIANWHKAWDNSTAKWAWCLHHAIEVEPLISPPEIRLFYILDRKKKSEQIRRIDNFRPVHAKLPTDLFKLVKPYRQKLKTMVNAYTRYDIEATETNWNRYLKAYDHYSSESFKYIDILNKYKDVLKFAHTIDVFDNTWNGVDIFKPGVK